MIILFWFIFTAGNILFNQLADLGPSVSYNAEYALAILAFIFIVLRDASTAIIAYIYSIYLVNKEYENSDSHEGEEG